MKCLEMSWMAILVGSRGKRVVYFLPKEVQCGLNGDTWNSYVCSVRRVLKVFTKSVKIMVEEHAFRFKFFPEDVALTGWMDP